MNNSKVSVLCTLNIILICMKNIIEINDITALELDVYARTSEVQLLRYNEPNPGLFIAESPKVIERALKAGYERARNS